MKLDENDVSFGARLSEMTPESATSDGEANGLDLPAAVDFVEGSEALIGGVLIEDRSGTVRLCTMIQESYPPQCGTGVIVTGVDWSKVPGGRGVDAGVRWSSCGVMVRLRSHDGAWTFVELDDTYDELDHMLVPPWIRSAKSSPSSPRWESPAGQHYLWSVRRDFRRLDDESRQRYLDRWPAPWDWTDAWAEITRP